MTARHGLILTFKREDHNHFKMFYIFKYELSYIYKEPKKVKKKKKA